LFLQREASLPLPMYVQIWVQRTIFFFGGATVSFGFSDILKSPLR
jgi:hypothetical protein